MSKVSSSLDLKPQSGKAQVVLGLYTVSCIAFLVMCTEGWDPRHKLAVKTFMMPLLAVWAFTGGQTSASISCGLIFATLGDFFLDLPPVAGEGPWFLLGMGFFFLMQVSYVHGLSSHIEGIPMLAMLAYIGALIYINVTIGPDLGDLQIPTGVYSCALVSMAVVTSGIGIRIGLGGFIFAVSDFMILLQLVKVDFPYRSPLIGATYVIA